MSGEMRVGEEYKRVIDVLEPPNTSMPVISDQVDRVVREFMLKTYRYHFYYHETATGTHAFYVYEGILNNFRENQKGLEKVLLEAFLDFYYKINSNA